MCARLNMEIIPAEVRTLASHLMAKGFPAFLVGGAARDLIAGRRPHDWDLATAATPGEMRRIADEAGLRIVPTGEKYGTMTFFTASGIGVEATTFRADGEYLDGRRPVAVEWGRSIEDDLARRDFTINAMAVSMATGEIVDPEGGVRDLHERIIRSVGDPRRRFQEDALRMLRAARLAAQLDFGIDTATKEAIDELDSLSRNVSPERVREELDKILLSGNPVRGLKSGLHFLAHFIPELPAMEGVDQGKHHAYDVLEHTFLAVEYAVPDYIVRISALFHDFGKPATRTVDSESGDVHFYAHAVASARLCERRMHELRYPRAIIERVTLLVREHMFSFDKMSDRAVRRLIFRVGRANVQPLVELRRADLLATGVGHPDPYITQLFRDIDRVLQQNPPTTMADLAVNGRDVMHELGRGPGEWVGKVLQYLLNEVVDDPSLNKREILLQQARRYRAKNEN